LSSTKYNVQGWSKEQIATGGNQQLIDEARRVFTELAIEHANETYPEVKHKLFDALDLPQDKTVLNKILSREKVPVKDEVIHFAKKYVVVNRREYSNGYLRKFVPTAQVLNEFGITKISHCTYENLKNFRQWLVSKGKANATINNYIKHLRQILLYASREEGAVIPRGINRLKNMKTGDQTHVVLSPSEIDELAKVNVYTPTEEIVRDGFVIRAKYLPYRQQEMYRLNSLDYHNGKVALIQQKTRGTVRIEIDKECKEMIDKHDWSSYPVQQTENLLVKKLCERAGIDAWVEDAKSVGGQLRVDKVPKFKRVSSHTARRSFVTNKILYGNGRGKQVTLEALRRITGHSSQEMLLQYAQLSEVDLELDL
jgi:integrase